MNKKDQQSKTFPNEQIHEIAQTIDVGYVCFVNPDTYEMEIMFNDEMFDHYGISWDEGEDEEEFLEDLPDWQKEMHADVKVQIKRINSWKRVIRVEKPESSEAFAFMERFVDEIIPEGTLKEQFWNALNRKHPFSNFNQIVHSCKYREDWFAFKQNELERYVRRELGIDE